MLNWNVDQKKQPQNKQNQKLIFQKRKEEREKGSIKILTYTFNNIYQPLKI